MKASIRVLALSTAFTLAVGIFSGCEDNEKADPMNTVGQSSGEGPKSYEDMFKKGEPDSKANPYEQSKGSYPGAKKPQ